jgi:hypothetical protein
MQESDQITTNQSALYYTRLHDFNNDGGLDGLELLLAVKHSLVHINGSFESKDLESFAGIVFRSEKYIKIIHYYFKWKEYFISYSCGQTFQIFSLNLATVAMNYFLVIVLIYNFFKFQSIDSRHINIP